MKWWTGLALAALLGASAGMTAPSAAFAAAAEAPSARPQIGRPVEQAQRLLREHRLKEALAKLAEADAVAHKTPYETYVIEATRASALLEAGDDRGAIRSLEAVLATQILPPAEALDRVETLVKLCYEAKDSARLATYVARYYREGGKDQEPHLLAAQALYQQGDFAGAAAASRAVLAANDRAGQPTPEAVLQLLANSAYRQHDAAGYRAALMQLVARDPKRDYWAALIAEVEKEPGFSDRLALDLARLKAATGTLAAPGDYVEAVQLALLAQLPGEAKSFLDQGYAAGILGKGADAARQQRLAATASRQANEDVQRLPAETAAAAAARNGVPSVRLGDAYASYGRYPEAIAAFQQGLGKGGLDHPEEAK
ncbi:MAG TPA: hypothetical protein VE397_06375, partial [Stellaceae bacterium]|nr:hypothetical protein [Stellaceae bacterium]